MKIVFHFALLLLTTLQIVFYSHQNALYIRTSYSNWRYFFLPDGVYDKEDAVTNMATLYTVADTITAIQKIQKAYFTMNVTCIANYELNLLPNGTVQPIIWKLWQNAQEFEYEITNSSLGAITEDMLRPHNDEQRAAFVQSMERSEFNFQLKDRQQGPWYQDCFDWTIQLSMNSMYRSVVEMKIMHADMHNCSKSMTLAGLMDRYLWVNVCILVCCIAYGLTMVFHDRPCWERDMVETFRFGYDFQRSTLKLVRILSLLLGLMMLFGSACWNISGMMAHLPTSNYHRFLQATGCLVLWLHTIEFFKPYPKMYSLVLTIRWGIPRVTAFLAGVFPVFIGFAVFGTIYFGNQVKGFDSVQSSMIQLFSIMNGDEILDSFDDLIVFYPIVGQIYLYGFLLLFMYVVLNVFIALIEESYFSTQNKNARRNAS